MISEILVNVSFLKHTLTKKDSGVVEGDYNSTKFVFNFEEDVSGGRVVFKLSNPQGELVFLQELTDNEIVLVGQDEEGYPCTLFASSGLYPFELVYYGDDSKLTSAPGYLAVSKRQVLVMDSTVTSYLPLFDKLAGDVGEFELFLRYSYSEDGTDFTEEWRSGQTYVGIAIGLEAPTTKEGYQWGEVGSLISGGNATNLDDGEPKGSLQQACDTDGDSIAGSKAFTIKSVNASSKIYVLDSTEGLEVGDVYSAHILKSNFTSEQKENIGKITNISGNVVTVDTFFPGSFTFMTYSIYEEQGVDSEVNTFRVIEKPDVGTRTLGGYSVALGAGCRSMSKGSFTHGRSNKAYGSYSFAGGKESYAGYCSFVHGDNCRADGMWSVAFNRSSKSLGKYSFTCGQNSEAWSDYSFAGGYRAYAQQAGAFAYGENPQVTSYCGVAFGRKIRAISGNTGEAAFGDFNLSSSDTLFSVGNGTGDADNLRKNALELKKSGDLLVQGTLKAPNSNLESVTADEIICTGIKYFERGLGRPLTEEEKEIVSASKLDVYEHLINLTTFMEKEQKGHISYSFEVSVGDSPKSNSLFKTLPKCGDIYLVNITPKDESLSYAGNWGILCVGKLYRNEFDEAVSGAIGDYYISMNPQGEVSLHRVDGNDYGYSGYEFEVVLTFMGTRYGAYVN